MTDWRLTGGQPEPLGVTLAGQGAMAGVNVAVFSANATRIEFCLFNSADLEIARFPLPERTGDVFHGHLSGVLPGMRYGLRAFGPWDPAQGHRFNPAKLLVDPYAALLDRRFQLHEALFDARARGASEDETDSAAYVPKAIVLPGEPEPVRRPRFDWAGQVFYELNVRGFTRLHPDVPLELRGSFAGLGEPAAVEHLAKLGVTTVELMPVMAWIDERHLPPLGLTNYWGYNPVVFGAPDPGLAPGGFDEIRRAIAALHAAGIRVVLDVVLNHTGESDVFGPTVSLRGLDHATYYRHATGDPGLLLNDAGTGNTLALERPPVLRLAMDMLRRWAATGLDGFRFDLGATLGRRADGFDPEAPFFAAMAQDPVLRDLALIAEPWDVGPGGYQVGRFPADWAEWNDHFRDAARRFWRGDAGQVGALATRLAGSADVFAARRRPLSRAINFVTAHDGFTLADLVSYSAKHNEANGEDNRDGTDANHSWNHGVEGPTTDPEVTARRRGDARALLATLLTARGTPMLTMGDECGRSQLGNNNAYAQDNFLTWLDWSKVDGGLARFTARLVALRRAHPALDGEAPLSGRPLDASGIPDVEWRAADGRVVAWDDPGTRVLVAVFYAAAAGEVPADRVAVALNAADDAVLLVLPEARDGFVWRLDADTSRPEAEPEEQAGDVLVPLAGRSVLVLVEVAAPERPRRAADPAQLERLAAAAGIAHDWWDVDGNHYPVGDDTKRALLTALKLPAGSGGEVRDSLAVLSEERFGRDLPLALVVRPGEAELVLGGTAATSGRSLDLVIALEDGSEQARRIRPEDGVRREVARPDGRPAVERRIGLPELPPGRHVLRLGLGECALTVAPRSSYLPPELEGGERVFGLAGHLYTLRGGHDHGIGDFSALAELAEAAGGQGARILGLNPLHALFPQDRRRASPYHPSDRRFLDPIYIDVGALAGPASVNDALAAGQGEFMALAARGDVDYAGVWSAKRAVLEAAFRATTDLPDADFAQFVTEGGAALQRFAAFQLLARQFANVNWRDWPDGFADAHGPAVAALIVEEPRRIRFELWQQWIADRQLAAAAGRAQAAGLSLGFYRDLAVGTAPDGAEAWSEAEALMAGVTIGAPPDPLGPEGQNWNLPPLDPLAMARDGYRSYGRLLAANMRHAGALRIDHVMGLRRLFLLPEGASAAEGAYLAYPYADLAGQVALESRRARCLVVGEDLGTVPEGMRAELDRERMLSYKVLWFERQGEDFAPPEQYPSLAAACVSTHDLPTLAGWWDGVDLAERRALGLDDEAAFQTALAERAQEKARLGAALKREGLIAELPAEGAPLDPGFLAAAHGYIARTPSLIALAQLDDLAGETVAVNLPGTDRERPNWRRRLSQPVDAVLDTPTARLTLAAMRAAR
ncbi:glycogen debranching protein GlgX [Ancylobacter sonchi]|uniref:glycogen debranching protein GlgX n=1 Tax=Ancylobacter sonchi TaxID=1937790 RepID=UPI001BD62BE6|nr:glycogen debranching protein GlgX [Ancylobacter sonchi]MBS7536630.1 glycogen debranching protein GlgX [Ancylobacter sonchi]